MLEDVDIPGIPGLVVPGNDIAINFKENQSITEEVFKEMKTFRTLSLRAREKPLSIPTTTSTFEFC